eukprot:CAMPEP_0196691312 /NCGR_PEP_ID=MMETSP1090-20130531/23233_1 /TAXON_ID=37098 /ORGANISM="Isochrysis sp, Strain CCMP1244" /LENGTH=94 /DNA_ID=CAMNT_0042030535 /DNA_START=24 /DNA_END=305 /DNA_ORIENTATION=+
MTRRAWQRRTYKSTRIRPILALGGDPANDDTVTSMTTGNNAWSHTLRGDALHLSEDVNSPRAPPRAQHDTSAALTPAPASAAGARLGAHQLFLT